MTFTEGEADPRGYDLDEERKRFNEEISRGVLMSA
jgi:hypothetical protein